jgi:hypothetical protein
MAGGGVYDEAQERADSPLGAGDPRSVLHRRPVGRRQACFRARPARAGRGGGRRFLYGPLASDPYRVGKLLRFELEGSWSARRGQYRVIYSIHDDEVLVRVVRNSHPRGRLRLTSSSRRKQACAEVPCRPSDTS